MILTLMKLLSGKCVYIFFHISFFFHISVSLQTLFPADCYSLLSSIIMKIVPHSSLMSFVEQFVTVSEITLPFRKLTLPVLP